MTTTNTADVSVNLQGFTPANRDALVNLTSVATGQRFTAKPFLDGSTVVRGLTPGMYEVEVTHPNLINPIGKRFIRIFPQVQPTQINIEVPNVLFNNAPIAETADANLGPVQSAATAVSSQALTVGSKNPGDAITHGDWNTMASAISDLATAVAQLTQLVSPRGHDHPEIAAKIDEVQGNVLSFTEAFGKAVLEIRRQFEIDVLRANTEEVLTLGGVDNATRQDVLGRIDNLQASVQKDTIQYTQLLSNFGAFIQTKINAIATSKGAAAQAFLADVRVQTLLARARVYTGTGVQSHPRSEMISYSSVTGEVLKTMASTAVSNATA